MIEHTHTISVDLSNKTKQDPQNGVSCFFTSTAFPSTPGVVEFIAQDTFTILLGATGNIRAFIAQRFNEPPQPNTGSKPQSSPKANLAPITTKIIAYPTGSGFESDWIVHERARLVDTDLYTKLNEQNRGALLVLDPPSGTWGIEDTQSLQATDGQTIIGPILTSKAARLLGETLDDVFELCRYPKELAQAPDGTPCAYKEMGRCPGVCDGSESIASYADRFIQATQAASAGIEHWKRSIQSQIAQASAALDFEHAQSAKRELEQVNKLPIDALGLARSLDAFSCVCITPAVRKGWAMVWVFGSQGLVPLVGVNGEANDIEMVIEPWKSPMGSTAIELDRFALIARQWMTKPSRSRRRRVTIFDLREADWQQRIALAIAQACVPTDTGHCDEEQTHIVR